MTYQRNETPEPLASGAADEFEALMPEPFAHSVVGKDGSPLWFSSICRLWPTKEQADEARPYNLSAHASTPLYTADQLRAALQSVAERAAKKEREQADELLKALKDLSSMYAQTWDLVDGGLTMMGESVPLFEKRHKAASAAIKRYEAAAIRAREGKGTTG
ncbi:hypothetical protein ABL840_08950 [Variovorax sp. NFACC27]|uniref:hypothetical protein n=1 Tax=unclassified Variovorax TaxID=663243 RepID=UPI000B89B34F